MLKKRFHKPTCLVFHSNDFNIDAKYGEEGTVIGIAIDNYTAQDINGAFDVIKYNSKDEQKKLNKVYYEDRDLFNRVLRTASQTKYRIEAFLLGLFPRHSVQVYKIMKCFG